MKLHIENFRPIKEADVEYGKLTIICGKNNTGKTYLTYTLYALLYIIENEMNIELSHNDFETLIRKAHLEINLEDYVQQYIQAVLNCKNSLLSRMPSIFAKHPDKCKDIIIDINLSPEEVMQQIHSGNIYHSILIQVSSNCKLTMKRNFNSPIITITMQNTGDELPYLDALKHSVQRLLVYAFDFGIDSLLFPKPFVITCERTGIAIFSQDIALAAMDMSDSSSSATPDDPNIRNAYLIQSIQGYQLPVNMNIKYVLGLRKEGNKKSFIAEKYSEILDFFEEISEGKFIFDNDTKQVLFIPNGSKDKLAMHEASSTVRSLMELFFYLNHLATPQQILIFDEPEQNLHPENQRKLARLLAMLVNVGINVLVTTHSDYILRELNILIQLNNKDAFLKQLQKAEGYKDAELLNAENIKAYVTERQADGITLKKARITQHDGITIDTLDEVIDKMNQIQDAIIWGE